MLTTSEVQEIGTKCYHTWKRTQGYQFVEYYMAWRGLNGMWPMKCLNKEQQKEELEQVMAYMKVLHYMEVK